MRVASSNSCALQLDRKVICKFRDSRDGEGKKKLRSVGFCRPNIRSRPPSAAELFPRRGGATARSCEEDWQKDVHGHFIPTH